MKKCIFISQKIMVTVIHHYIEDDKMYASLSDSCHVELTLFSYRLFTYLTRVYEVTGKTIPFPAYKVLRYEDLKHYGDDTSDITMY